MRWLADLARRPLTRAVLLPLLLAAVVLRSVFGPGYLVQTDIAFGPRPAPVDWSFYAPVQILVNAIQAIAGGEVAGKLYVFAALFACGCGAILVLRDAPWWGQAAGGALAMLNPYVYDRLVEGQWGVVMATGGLFLVIAAWRRLRRVPGPLSAAALVGAALFTLMFSVEFAAIVGILLLALALAESDWRAPAFARWVLTAVAGLVVTSLYGVLGFFLGGGNGGYQAVAQFSAADYTAFQASPAPHLGVVPAVLGLYGEWSEKLLRYPVADHRYPWWFIASAVLVALAVAGAWVRRPLAWLLAVGAIGVAISVSTATAAGQSIVVTLAQHVPIVGAYREPQKFDALWLVALAALGGAAIAAAADRFRGRGRLAVISPLLALLLVGAALAPAGWVELTATGDVVQPVAYPASWYATSAYLSAHVAPDDPVAVFPWHLYETLPLTGRLTVDPAHFFFPGTLRLSSDPELYGRPATDPIGSALRGGGTCSLANTLRRLGIRHAIIINAAVDATASEQPLIQCGFAVVYNAARQVEVLSTQGA